MAKPSICQDPMPVFTLNPSKLKRTFGPSRTSIRRTEPYSISCLPALNLIQFRSPPFRLRKMRPGNPVSFRRSASGRRCGKNSTRFSAPRTSERDCRMPPETETLDEKAIRLLKRQLEELQTVRGLNYKDPSFKAWYDTTMRVLETFLGRESPHF